MDFILTYLLLLEASSIQFMYQPNVRRLNMNVNYKLKIEFNFDQLLLTSLLQHLVMLQKHLLPGKSNNKPIRNEQSHCGQNFNIHRFFYFFENLLVCISELRPETFSEHRSWKSTTFSS